MWIELDRTPNEKVLINIHWIRYVHPFSKNGASISFDQSGYRMNVASSYEEICHLIRATILEYQEIGNVST
jgi:hypothetical protein